jgi:beta-lactamase class A
MVVMKKVERGDWRLSDEITLMNEDRDSEWGDLYMRPLGSRITIEQLLHEMLTASDNTAFRMLYRNVSNDELQDVITALGLEELFTPDGKITTKEYTRLFRALYTSSYLDREHSQLILDALTKSDFDNYLGTGIPDEVPFAHKIGENVGEQVMLDAGIIYIKDRPILISVGINYGVPGMTREHAHEVMEDIASKSYRYISEYRADK